MTFHPTRITIETGKASQTIVSRTHTHTRLTEVLRHADLPLNTRCGERGLCDGCLVELIAGTLVNVQTQQAVGPSDAGVLVRACEHQLQADGADLTIRIPPRSLLAHQPQVVSEFRINVPWSHDPIDSGDQAAGVSEGPNNTAHNNGQHRYGVAVDIGTTTVAVLLVDLATGTTVGQAAGFNRQMGLGDDVLTRINLCSTDPQMLSRLQQTVIKSTLGPLIAEALRTAGPGVTGPITAMTFAGNTTMLHLAAGVDPSSMGIAPFTPVFLEHRTMRAHEIGLALPAAASVVAGHSAEGEPLSVDPVVHLLPGAAAYVGADLVAGILSSGLAYDPGPSLLVDVGTNGEIIFKHGDTLLGCATAAGPAFEGSRLTSGLRAGEGAISAISFTARPFAIHTRVIGDTAPIGLCGSAYIDFLADARRVGLLSPTGRFDRDFLHRQVPPDCLRTGEDDGAMFRVAQSAGQRDILVSETDVAALLQAKAAIAAGILTLLAHAGVTAAQVKTVYLAGGFGTRMNRNSAMACGLLPGFNARQVQVVGNSSLAGALLALLDSSVIPELHRIAKRMRIIELNLDPSFEDRYIDQLSLP
jgi:uncharacterized 2Fe-2S/4Fe-4S cluster protein (DUF4445 family)